MISRPRVAASIGGVAAAPSHRRGPGPTPRLRGLPCLLLFVLLLAGCSPREHTNPFDPDNEDTGGSPGILTAVAGNSRVSLKWDLESMNDLDHVRIVRTEAGGGSRVIADSLAAGVGTFTDTDVQNETTYDYVLEIFFDGQAEPARSRTAPATPGARIIWVLDQRTGGPFLISPDGRQQVAAPGQGRPSDLDVHPATGDVFSVDFFNQRIERFNRDGKALYDLPIAPEPLSVALVPADTSIWVGSYDPSAVTHYPRLLTPTIESDTLNGVPEDLAFDAARGDLWIADSDQGRLLHRRPDGSRGVISGFRTPFSVAVDAASGDAWLVDRVDATLYRIDRDTESVTFSNNAFAAPFQVIADPSTGGAWVTDNASARVVLLDGSGAVVQALTGLDEPTGIALDPGDGSLWVTDRGNRDELVHLSRTGEILTRSGGFASPFAVAVAIPSR